MFGVLISLIAVAIALYLLYIVTTANHDYFKLMGLKYIRPLPLVGSSGYAFFSKKGIYEKTLEFYYEYPNEKIIGVFDFGVNIFLIKDTDLLKQLGIKDFAHFQDHRQFADSNSDDFFGNTLFALRGKAWRDMRSTLSPLFTGSKMRVMLHLINHCGKQLVDHLQDECKETGKVNYKAKQLFLKYTNDVIASCAFGLECNSLKNTDNEFLEVGQEFLKFQQPLRMLKFMLIRFAPRLTRKLGIKLFSDKVNKMFKRLIIQTMDMRKESGIERPDMIQLLMTLKDGNFANLNEKDNKKLEADMNQINGEVKNSWTDNEIIAQSFIFFLAGFDTSSNVMQFLFYELGVHQAIQQRLYEEILQTNEKLKGERLTYDAMKGMKYMAMVINEALRKWPPAVALDRLCVKDYCYEDESGLKFTIHEGDVLNIPVHALQTDPANFPNPDVFDPERFSDDNIENINMDAFVPFGVGPRNCIGFRFALMEVKSLLYYLLLNFKINIGKDTDVPMKLKRSLFGLVPEREIQLEFQLRSIKKNL